MHVRRAVLAVTLVFASACPPPPQSTLGRLTVCSDDDDCPAEQACLAGKCSVICDNDNACEINQLCIERQCTAKLAPTITFAEPSIEIFTGEPAIDVTPTVNLGPQDTTAAIVWHALVTPDGAAPIADFSGPTLHFVPITVGYYAFEVTATHRAGIGRNVLIIRVNEDAFVGQLERDGLGTGLYRLTTNGSLTLMQRAGVNESFSAYKNLDAGSAVYGLFDSIQHPYFEAAAFAPMGWFASSPSGSTNDCSSASPSGDRCCSAGYVMIDRDPDFYCCPSSQPAASGSNCCPASYRTVSVTSGTSSYDLCCPDDGLTGYEHEPERVVGTGNWGACVLKTERKRFSLHQWSQKGVDNRPLLRLLSSVGAVDHSCELGLEPSQVTTAPYYECDWNVESIAAHPNGTGFALLVSTRSNSGINPSTNEILLYIEPSKLAAPLVVSNGVIPHAAQLIDRKTLIPDASRTLQQLAFRHDGVLVVLATGEAAPSHRLMWFDPVARLQLGSRDIAVMQSGSTPILNALSNDLLIADSAAMRIVPLVAAASSEAPFGLYAGNAGYPALDSATQSAMSRCGGSCDPSVTSIPAYTDGACDSDACCACLRDQGATQNPVAVCQATAVPAQGVSRSEIGMVVASSDGSKALITRAIFETTAPGCAMFIREATRREFQIYDTASQTLIGVPAPSGLAVSNLEYVQGGKIAGVGFAARTRQVLLTGPLTGDVEHLNVWLQNTTDGASKKLLPNDVVAVCSTAQPGLLFYVTLAVLLARRRRR